MNPETYKSNYFSKKAQCTILDQEGFSLDSCNTFFDHKKNSQSFFESDLYLRESFEQIDNLKQGESIALKKLSLKIGSEEKIFDYEISYILHDNQPAFLWVLADYTTQYGTKENGSKLIETPAKGDAMSKAKSLPRFGTILIADDDDISLLLLRSVLTGFGLRADYAKDGAAALKMYHEKHYDLMVLDNEMPEMNGLEVVAKIREKDSDIPIVLLSGIDLDSEDLSQVSVHLSKPLQKEQLKSVMIEVLGERAPKS